MQTFILAGQSNMRGCGVAAELPAELATPDPRVLIFDGQSFVTYDPANVPGQKPGIFGPEVTFGRAMADALDGPVALIKLAVGGTSLHTQWRVHENPQASDALFAQLLRKIDSARTVRDDLNFAGMLWMQGERDSRFIEDAEHYADNFVALIEKTRLAVGVSDLPFVAGRVNPPRPDDPDGYPYQQVIRQVHESPGVSRYAWIDCDDLPKRDDNLHYNNAGLIEMGTRFAGAIQAL